MQRRFYLLVSKRQIETLTPDEHNELLTLTDQIEKSDAERIAYIAKLATLRRVSLETLMTDLAIHPPDYV